MFVDKCTYKEVKAKLRVRNVLIGKQTIAVIFSDCRRVCRLDLERPSELKSKIGGPGVIVQVDETKFGKRKYYRSRHVDGTWIFGAIDDDTDEVRLAICPNNKLSKDVLHKIILDEVQLETEIRSDCWKAYIGLDDIGYVHSTGNHSEAFVDPESGVHTQKIESFWRTLKMRIQKRGIRIPSPQTVRRFYPGEGTNSVSKVFGKV